jgi:transposase InsO family protein
MTLTGIDRQAAARDPGSELLRHRHRHICIVVAVPDVWGRLQVELLNRRTWKTRIELAAAIHDYIEAFHNTRRRHSSLQMLTPSEYEHRHLHTHNAA